MRLYHIIFPTLIATFLLLAGCAPPVPPSTDTANFNLEMRRLRNDLQTQQQTIAALEQSVRDLEEKLAAQEQQFSRMKGPARSVVVTSQDPTFTVGSPGLSRTGEATAPTATGDGTPTEVYLQAFGNYASGRYPEAILGFETFLQRFPNNSYAANAQFWLADSYFNQQQYPQAIDAFQHVIQGYPRAAKAPDALLKIATAQLHMGDNQNAQQTLATLQQRFPQSTAAAKAKELELP